jgi:hypothetical protein
MNIGSMFVLEDNIEINTALDDDDKVSKTRGVVESGKPMKVIFYIVSSISIVRSPVIHIRSSCLIYDQFDINLFISKILLNHLISGFFF